MNKKPSKAKAFEGFYLFSHIYDLYLITFAAEEGLCYLYKILSLIADVEFCFSFTVIAEAIAAFQLLGAGSCRRSTC